MTKHRRWFSILALVAALLLSQSAALAQGFPSQSGEDTPPTGTTDTPGGFPSQGGQTGRGGVFQSQDFGFTLTWGPAWNLVEQTGGPGEGFEGVALENGASFVSVMGISTTDIPQDIVMNIANGGTTPLTFDTLVFDEPDRAAAYFATDDPAVAVFIDALAIDSSSAFAVIWAFPTAQYDAEFEAFLELMGGLT